MAVKLACVKIKLCFTLENPKNKDMFKMVADKDRNEYKFFKLLNIHF